MTFRHILTAILLVAWLASLLIAATAEAQPDHVMLARTCISERGFRTDTDDCAAIAAVIRTRAEAQGETFREAMRALSPNLHGGTITSREWLLDIDADCHRPRGLGRALWEGMRREACEATMIEAEALIANAGPSPCSEPPEAWGSDADVRRGRARGGTWREIDCGETLNRTGRWLP